ncbi:alpha/beta fold hydrolase [Variovorax sp. PCZ-1]|uniref:alpha/beta hydrolase family protein n=1 Tax=Variovorax sp. PCZ-1 TaxID=2835533 RepID=UPI001BCF4A59|nr:alpha/beta fold hydrolase [Variovorax sp. PCZ-1]MBS7809208.1 alpha/beta fold hydrolase [Variovorax sp. PCZ-1]
MTSQDILLNTADGYKLSATHYTPQQAALDPTSGRAQYIVIGCATAVPRGFYKRFCEFAASLGLYAIVADYRGIGGSKQGSLKGFKMDYADWSVQDLGAAVQYAHERGEVYLVGHSLGGHALGQLPDPSLIRAAYFCGSGAGWAGWMPLAERIKVWCLWNVIGPVATTLLGYQPMSKFGMGEDIPLGVYRDWRRWCSFPRYFFDDSALDAKVIAAKFDRVRMPVAACVSTDDLWAPPKSRDAFFSGYKHTNVDRIDLTAVELGVEQIGHMGYFRKEVGAALWPQIMVWLQKSGLKTQA